MDRKVFFGSAIARATNALLSLLRNRINLKLTREEFRFSRISFSQYGEDLAVLRWLDEEHLNDVASFYVDAGCFHPIWFSNTLLLHKRGWCGLNVDLNLATIDLFMKLRPRDMSVCAALSDVPRAMTRLKYTSGGLTDRISGSIVNSVLDEEPVDIVPVQTTTLDEIIAQSTRYTGRIGYLNIDCEGHDLSVLKGLSLAKYRPAIITIEGYSDHEKAKIIPYLARFGYSHKETLHRTLLFVRDACLPAKGDFVSTV